MGTRALAGGLLLEVRPLPMAAALLTVLLGFAWAQGDLLHLPSSGPPLIACVFFGLYTAHLVDTYVDFVKRGERTPADFPLLFRDSSGLIQARHYPPLIAASAGACVLLALPAAARGGWAVAGLLGFGLALSLAYAPLLDRALFGVSLGYPSGALAVLGAAYLAAGGRPDLRFGGLALSLFLALVGTKVRSDLIDFKDDKALGKRTVAVVLGPRACLGVGYGLGGAGLALAALLPLMFAVSPFFAVPAAGAALVWAATARAEPFRASMAMAGALFVLLVLEVAVVGFVPPA